MNHNYFEVKARYDKVLENGSTKKVTEPYIIDAMSFAEAEARAIDGITPYVSGDVEVRTVKRTPIAEVSNPYAEKFFIAKVAFISIDERTNAEKKTASQMLIGASDFDEAMTALENLMRGTASDWELVSLYETPIKEIFIRQ